VIKPFRIGLTGGIGSGKSTVAGELALLGTEIVSGDELGRQTLEQSPELLKKIRDRFGDGVFDSQGVLIRRALGKRVFADRVDVQWLTDATFAGIHSRWLAAVEHTASAVIVFDAALIFEWGIEKDFDLLLVVTAPAEKVQTRLEASGRLSAAEAQSRLAGQIPPESKAAAADVVLHNDGSLDTLRTQVQQIWKNTIEPELSRRRN
jgi:dephospho-CoA kinase